ncbi:hypothetical protein SAMD00019534_039090 [Acytostelium subglobosum LB1]|uniref:hypothetical protein n=1 Tax=Acytostelium subglobosum LB1 TaxID=1410327 RepID=UPI000644ADFE|nr:hypothetical protein SAMD00019534_039090 [Acytostelium subglobosum LB1]GAM20734.1 hypothetical protein SAMD00019534_039090 [Acytostelium subglobosum LB1]|eukprot:XP_012755868.1 hypothetical protein SAMD00019534_039090 [Acytostelium subglobosum LB1]
MSLDNNNNDDSDGESSSSSSSSSSLMENAPLIVPATAGNQLSSKTLAMNAKNINLMVLTVFLSSIGFTLMMPSMYPYLKSEAKADAKYNGPLVAIYSFGQFVASPVFGYWGNRRPTIEAIIVSTLVAMIGNGIYAFTSEFGQAFIPMIFTARFLVGVGAGNVAVCRAFASERTDASNKTQTMGKMSGAQGAGFVIGPVIGFALSKINFNIGSVVVSEYTAPGFVSVILGLVNLVLILLYFRETPVVAKPAAPSSLINSPLEEETLLVKKDEPKESLLPVFVSIYLFAVVISIFAVFESILTVMTNYYYKWGTSQNGLLMTCSVFVSIGYPIASSLMYAIYSKILNPSSQGTMMGWLTSGGSLARMFGPLWANALFGVADDILFFTSAGLTASGFIVLCIFYHKLAPRKQPVVEEVIINTDNYNTTPIGETTYVGSISVRDE